MNKKYIVFYYNGGSVGSLIKTKKNLEKANKEFDLSLIQENNNGTLYYEILAKKRCSKAGTKI